MKDDRPGTGNNPDSDISLREITRLLYVIRFGWPRWRRKTQILYANQLKLECYRLAAKCFEFERAHQMSAPKRRRRLARTRSA